MVGHSAGGSAALELERHYPNITPITYNAPVFAQANPESYINPDNLPLRFTSGLDPVSMFDMNARTTLKAPELNLESIQKRCKCYSKSYI